MLIGHFQEHGAGFFLDGGSDLRENDCRSGDRINIHGEGLHETSVTRGRGVSSVKICLFLYTFINQLLQRIASDIPNSFGHCFYHWNSGTYYPVGQLPFFWVFLFLSSLQKHLF